MPRTHLVSGIIVAGAAVLGLAACGSSPTTSSSGSSSSGGGGSNSGSSFCQQAASLDKQLTSLSAGLVNPNNPTATPDVASFKQVFATTAQAIDSLDGSAPSEIAAAFHQVRTAYDSANSSVQSAQSFTDMSKSLGALNTSQLQAANTSITNYFANVCGISSAASAAAASSEPSAAPSPT